MRGLPATLPLHIDARGWRGKTVDADAGRVRYEYEYVEHPREQPDANAVAYTDYGALLAVSTMPDCAALALADWVRSNVRYVAVYADNGSVVPHAADEVLAMRYGDCKDYTALLDAVCIPSTATLISNGNAYALSTAPMFGALNLRVTYVPGRWSEGDIMRVTLHIVSHEDNGWLAIDDPIPSGAAILDKGLGGKSIAAQLADRDRRTPRMSRSSYVERGSDSYRAYYARIGVGEWDLSYTVCLNNAGTFRFPATRVEAMYAPEIFGKPRTSPWTSRGDMRGRRATVTAVMKNRIDWIPLEQGAGRPPRGRGRG